MTTYKTNPFIKTLFIKESTKIKKIANSDLKIIDSTGKKIEDNIVYAKEHNVDRTPFVKLFNTKFLLKLGSTGIALFDYICNHAIRYNTDYIVLYNDDILSRTKYNSIKSIYKGINELINAKLLAKSNTPNIYWINPAIIYKGERWYLQK